MTRRRKKRNKNRTLANYNPNPVKQLMGFYRLFSCLRLLFFSFCFVLLFAFGDVYSIEIHSNRTRKKICFFFRFIQGKQTHPFTRYFVGEMNSQQAVTALLTLLFHFSVTLRYTLWLFSSSAWLSSSSSLTLSSAPVNAALLRFSRYWDRLDALVALWICKF